MASTKFIKGIDNEKLIDIVWDVVNEPEDRLIGGEVTRDGGTSGNPYDVYVTYRTRLDGEDEDAELTDTYEVDDYDVVPCDWSGDTRGITLAWRKAMFAKFGEAYSNHYLFGMLEDSVKTRDGNGWLLED